MGEKKNILDANKLLNHLENENIIFIVQFLVALFYFFSYLDLHFPMSRVDKENNNLFWMKVKK